VLTELRNKLMSLFLVRMFVGNVTEIAVPIALTLLRRRRAAEDVRGKVRGQPQQETAEVETEAQEPAIAQKEKEKKAKDKKKAAEEDRELQEPAKAQENKGFSFLSKEKQKARDEDHADKDVEGLAEGGKEDGKGVDGEAAADSKEKTATKRPRRGKDKGKERGTHCERTHKSTCSIVTMHRNFFFRIFCLCKGKERVLIHRSTLYSGYNNSNSRNCTRALPFDNGEVIFSVKMFS